MACDNITEQWKEMQTQLENRVMFLNAARSLHEVLQKIGALNTGCTGEIEAYKASLVALVRKLDSAKPPSPDPAGELPAAAGAEGKADRAGLIGTAQDAETIGNAARLSADRA
jgi:hypothetical protein